MSNMLNFKYGLHSKLPSAISNGTIYVTTDEKAMYVDLGNNRIRLSSVINCTYAEWTQLTPPYSQEALYYITDKNALVKYSSDGGSDKWIQINSTADIENILSAMGFYGEAPSSPKRGDIYTDGVDNYIYDDTKAEGQKWVSVGTVGSKILDLQAAFAALNETVSGHTGTLTGLRTDVNAAAADIDNLENVIGFKGVVTADPTTGSIGDVYIVNGTIKVCTAVVEGAPTWEALGNESTRIEALKAYIQRVEQNAGTAEGVGRLAEALDTLTKQVNDPATGLPKTYEIADAAKKTADNALPAASFETWKTDTYATDKQGLVDQIGGVAEELNTYKNAQKTVTDGLDQRLGEVEGSYLKKSGDSLTGNLSAGTHKITNLAAPDDEGDAVNKKYVDDTVKVAKDKADKGVADAAKAAEAAATAQGKANEAYSLAEEAKGIAEAAVTDGELADAIKDFVTDTELAAAKTNIVGKKTDGTDFDKTVKDVSDVADAAAQKAEDQKLRIDTIVAGNGTIKTFAKAEEEIGKLSQSIAKLDDTYATDAELSDAKTELLGDANSAAGSATIAGANKAAAAAADQAEEQKSRVDTILTGASDYNTLGKVETKLDAIDKTISELGNTYATDAEVASEIEQLRGNTDETLTLASIDNKVEGHAERIESTESKVKSLESELLSKIQTADAMVYRGTVANEAELATKSAALGGASVGDTYKATAEFVMANGTEVNIGDLLIAKGTEENGVITSNLTWDHVPSGYVANYNPTLSVVSVANSNIVDVNLTSAHSATANAGDLGDFQISAQADSAVTVSAVGNNIAIGMVWGTFD